MGCGMCAQQENLLPLPSSAPLPALHHAQTLPGPSSRCSSCLVAALCRLLGLGSCLILLVTRLCRRLALLLLYLWWP